MNNSFPPSYAGRGSPKSLKDPACVVLPNLTNDMVTNKTDAVRLQQSANHRRI